MSEPDPNQKNAGADAKRFAVDASVRTDCREAFAESVPGHDGQPGAGRPREVGGRGGLDPTRYGDWEYKGRCIDF